MRTETLARICQLCPGALIVITSGYASEEAHWLMSSGNVEGFIQKPYTAQQLVGLIDQMLLSQDATSGSRCMAGEGGVLYATDYV